MIYFDHAATTPIANDVQNVMNEYGQKLYGNPSSIHHIGREAKFHLEEARRILSTSIGAKEEEIYFTSGGTEANNLAIIGTALSKQTYGKHIITSKQEHHAVLHTMEYLESIGFTVTYLSVDQHGRLHAGDVKKAIQHDTILVSIMMVNNETGVVQPIEEIGSIVKDTDIVFHTDAVQAYGMLPMDVNDLGVDLLTTSSHKIHGPKGIGFLYNRSTVSLHPLLFGGNQERGMRPGTENVIGAIGFAKAVK